MPTVSEMTDDRNLIPQINIITLSTPQNKNLSGKGYSRSHLRPLIGLPIFLSTYVNKQTMYVCLYASSTPPPPPPNSSLPSSYQSQGKVCRLVFVLAAFEGSETTSEVIVIVIVPKDWHIYDHKNTRYKYEINFSLLLRPDSLQAIATMQALKDDNNF